MGGEVPAGLPFLKLLLSVDPGDRDGGGDGPADAQGPHLRGAAGARP